MEQQNSTGLVVTAEPPVLRGSSWNVLFLPLAFTAGLAVLTILPPVRENSRLLTAFLVAVAFLFTWNAFLLFWTRRTGRVLTVDLVVKKQHAVQACAQAAVLLYWGWYWREVYTSAYLIGAQLLFAYAFDLLLGWSRRDKCTLGFAQFPIVLSINLFLWFKPDWFYLQFLMVAVGLTAKELIRWNKDGRKVHIFNPSSFPLALFSLLLLAKGASDITWGHQISITQFYPPHMYLFLFLIALPGQLFFGVTSMTMSAVVTTYLFGLLYQAATGVYFFYDSYIPIAVFLGMHLLFNDPSTSPRTELGRIIYGALYGLSTVLLYRLLGSFGMPTFYDKLLQVPVLNLSVQWIDRLARSRWLRAFDPAAWGKLLPALRRNLAYISIWIVIFAGMSAAQGVGDNHPGQWLPFWRNACQEGRAYACPYLADVELGFCNQGSGWACNDAGLMDIALARSGEDLRRLDPAQAAAPFTRGCQAGFQMACENLIMLTRGVQRFAYAPPTLKDYPIILRGSKGEIRDRRPSALYALACREGWKSACAISGGGE
ncbi:MAG: hypothetical protein WBE37_07205 [Bryobacteraceae bacterium]